MTITGSGKRAVETRPVSGFDRVDLTGVGKVVVKQNGTESLTIEGDDNILPIIRTEVLGGTLRIGIQDNTNIHPQVPLIFNVTVNVLAGLSLSGAGSIEADDLKASNFETRISGAGSTHLANLTADSLRATLSGAGDFKVSGTVAEQEVVISGAGSYRAGDLQSRDATVRASGAGSATVRVSERLNANLSGVGSIRYYGSPVVQQHRSGLGSIAKAGD